MYADMGSKAKGTEAAKRLLEVSEWLQCAQETTALIEFVKGPGPKWQL